MSEREAQFTSSIARLSEDGESHVVHGVALGEGDRTRGKHGPKAWPREVLEPAAASLADNSVTYLYDNPKDHGGEPIGRVTQSAYEPGVGVVYEAELRDADVAKKLALGQLEVSIEGGRPERVEHDDDGAAILHGFEFTGMAVVEKGASPSNHAAGGTAADNPAVAALSAGDIDAMLGGDDTQADDSAKAGEDLGQSGHSSDTMTEDNTDDFEALLSRLDTKEERIEELRTELSEAREARDEAIAAKKEAFEEKEAIEAELSETEEIAEEAAREYAAELASEHFSEDDLVERFDVAELAEKYREDEEASLTADVQSGDGGGANENAELSSEENEEVAHLREQIDHYEGRGWDAAAEKKRARLTELTGEDN